MKTVAYGPRSVEPVRAGYDIGAVARVRDNKSTIGMSSLPYQVFARHQGLCSSGVH